MKENLEEILKFENDNNGFPKLTEKNVKLINFILKHDSSYKYGEDEDRPDNIKNIIEKLEKHKSKEILDEVIKIIDKQNSTHLTVSGNKKGNNEGRKLTSYYIDKIGIRKVILGIKNGNRSLVDDIAKNSIKNRYIISFASKFCTYMSRYMFNSDKFSIYDGVVSKILPYYYYQYVRKDKKIRVTNNMIKKNGYEWYIGFIDEIIEKVEEKENYKISRKDLDHLLWYYYKGDKDIKDEKKNIIHKSLTTRAIELIK